MGWTPPAVHAYIFVCVCVAPESQALHGGDGRFPYPPTKYLDSGDIGGRQPAALEKVAGLTLCEGQAKKLDGVGVRLDRRLRQPKEVTPMALGVRRVPREDILCVCVCVCVCF